MFGLILITAVLFLLLGIYLGRVSHYWHKHQWEVVSMPSRKCQLHRCVICGEYKVEKCQL